MALRNAFEDLATEATLATRATEATLASILAALDVALSTRASQATLASVLTALSSVAVTGPLTDTQLRASAVPVSAAALPLPSGAATEAGNLATIAGKDFATQTTLALIRAKTDNIDVALSTRTKPADQQHVIVDSSAAVPVTGPLTDTQLRATPVPVSGTVTASGPLTDTQLRASAVPISAVALPLPSGAALDASLAALLSEAQLKADLSETQLVSDATLAAKDFATEATLVELAVAQDADATDLTGPMVQGRVSDTPNSFMPDTLQPLSLTSAGRLRVSSAPAEIDQVWTAWGSNPFAQENPFEMEAHYV
jgi:hypothetical protein